MLGNIDDKLWYSSSELGVFDHSTLQICDSRICDIYQNPKIIILFQFPLHIINECHYIVFKNYIHLIRFFIYLE